MSDMEGVPLYEFDKEEWWDVMCRAVTDLGGTISRDEFEEMWAEFCEMKRLKAQH